MSMYEENNMNHQFNHTERDTVSYYQQQSHALPGFDSFRRLSRSNTKQDSAQSDCSLWDLGPSIPHRSISLSLNQPLHSWDNLTASASSMNVQVKEEIVNPGDLIEETGEQSDEGQSEGESQINCECDDKEQYELNVDGGKSNDVEVNNRSDLEPEKHLSRNNKSQAGKLFKKSSPPSKLTIHNRTYTGARTYKCHWESCSKEFVNRYHLPTHYRTHTGERPFKCHWPSCNKAFSQNPHLKRHYNIHIGERAYECPWNNCRKKFFQKQHLKIHYKIHIGEKKFECPFNSCSKKFVQKQHMQRHYRSHIGERPFKCPWTNCPMAFFQKHHMKKHLMTHGTTPQCRPTSSWQSRQSVHLPLLITSLSPLD